MTWASQIISQHLEGMFAHEYAASIIYPFDPTPRFSNRQAQMFRCIFVGELDRFGLITDRAVLVEQFTTEQNLAMPLSLDIEHLTPTLREQIRVLAYEVGLTDEELKARTAALPPAAQVRLRLGRALALGPRVLLAEHPNAALPTAELTRFATDLARITATRGLASLITTVDSTFASALTDRVLRFEPASGLLRPASGWRRWFS